MIAMLKGRVESIEDGHAVIDVNGVGYLALCTTGTLSKMAVGEAVTLHIETQVREDFIRLYGFIDPAEREWFRLLITVQGVGAKVAVAMLSTLCADELMRAVASSDKAMIGRAPGVGPKLAARIATELKDKVAAMALGPQALDKASATQGDVARAPGLGSETTRDAVSALVNLGYSPSDALSAVSHAASAMTNEAGETASIEMLVKGGLAELGPKEHGQ